jgi:hypothetical protein
MKHWDVIAAKSIHTHNGQIQFLINRHKNKLKSTCVKAEEPTVA